MDNLIKFLNDNNTEYNIGIIRGDYYFNLPYVKKEQQVIKFKWNKSSIDKLLLKFKERNIVLLDTIQEKYYLICYIDGILNPVLVEYAVKSHIQLPNLILQKFRTGDNLYYINTIDNNIYKSSAKNYNTKFGYYSLFFEEYLSNNYEKILNDIITIFLPFIKGDIKSISFENWRDDINKIFLMAIFRNPKQIEYINKISVFSNLIKSGYSPEMIAFTGERLKNNFIKGFKPIPIVNRTKKNLVIIKSLVSDMKIDNGINIMVIVLHPKLAIALVPDNYYVKMLEEQGKNSYLLIHSESEIKKFNKQVYITAKYNKEDIIGIKEDLEELQIVINHGDN